MSGNTKMEMEIEEDLDFQSTLDYADDVQYENAVVAIGRIETDRGGLGINKIWAETEKLRELMIRTPREKRETMILVHAIPKLMRKYGNDKLTLMCILTMFALRLIKASKTPKDENPHVGIIRAIVRHLGYYAERDGQLMKELRELIKTIDTDGDKNEALGKVVAFDDDILSIDDGWRSELRIIVELYKKKADEADIIQYGPEGDAFDRVWEALLNDNEFVAEMKRKSLGQDFNLLLLFSIYGLMYPWAYNTKVKGAKSLAKTIGYNPNSRNKDKCYSKDYFNIYEIKKLKEGIKTQLMLDHIQKIIKTCKTEKQ